MTHWIDIFIVALLPIAALFTVVQSQPYFALISRGILGVVAVMLYALMGAPDVALTEALVGTLLTVILYVITVRSTLVLRMGRLTIDTELPEGHPLRCFCSRYKLALKNRVYSDERELVQALKEGQIDAVKISAEQLHKFFPQMVVETDQPLTLLAPHGRWHERKMKEMFPEQWAVVRLSRAKESGEV